MGIKTVPIGMRSCQILKYPSQCQWMIFQIPQSNPESCVSDITFTKKYDLHSLYYNNTIWQNISSLLAELWVQIPLMRCTQYYMYIIIMIIKFVSDLQQVCWFSLCTLVSSTNKNDHHNLTEIFLKVAWNTIILTLNLKQKRL